MDTAETTKLLPKESRPAYEALAKLPMIRSGSGSSNKLDNKLGSEADLLSATNINSLEKAFRRKSYNELPFISTFGMTTRESAVKKTMSMEGLNALAGNPLVTPEVRWMCSFLRSVLTTHQ